MRHIYVVGDRPLANLVKKYAKEKRGPHIEHQDISLPGFSIYYSVRHLMEQLKEQRGTDSVALVLSSTWSYEEAADLALERINLDDLMFMKYLGNLNDNPRPSVDITIYVLGRRTWYMFGGDHAVRSFGPVPSFSPPAPESASFYPRGWWARPQKNTTFNGAGEDLCRFVSKMLDCG